MSGLFHHAHALWILVLEPTLDREAGVEASVQFPRTDSKRSRMSRILLVSANMTTEPYPVYPLGMAVIASVLTKRGHLVKQFDILASGASEDALRECFRAFQPDFIGISLRNLDGCDSLSRKDYPAVAKGLVEVLREEGSQPILLGGPAFSLLPEELLAYTGADFGIVGEGEGLVEALIESLEKKEQTPRIWRSAHPLGGREMASPLYDEDLLRFYLEKSGIVNLQTKRGCPFGCIYCNYPQLEGDRYRTRPSEVVVDDLASAQMRGEKAFVFFTDGVFNDPQGHYLEVAEAMLRRGLKLRWGCYLRPQGLHRKELLLLKRAGLSAVELGTDAGCDITLRALNKGFTFQDVFDANEALVDCEIPCAHFVMFGGPEESEETLAEGLANLERLRSTVVFVFAGIRIYPKTALWSRAICDGLLTSETSPLEPVYYQSPHIETGRMVSMIEAAFKGRRDRFFPPEKGRERMEILQQMG